MAKKGGYQYTLNDLIPDTSIDFKEENNQEDNEEETIDFDFNSLFINDVSIERQNNEKSLAILGDSLAVLKGMQSKSIDLIFADAPYNIGKNFGNNSDKWESVSAYVNWCKEWIDEYMFQKNIMYLAV